MSMESAKSFIERVNTDEDFAQKVSECKDPESRMTFVKSQGFDFTGEEVRIASWELRDEELEQVAGSGDVPSSPPLLPEMAQVLAFCMPPRPPFPVTW